MNTSSPHSLITSPAQSNTNETNQLASRQSGRVTFPNSARSRVSNEDSTRIVQVENKRNDGNPFKLPPDNNIFTLRDKERQQKKQDRIKQRSLKVHEKTTHATRINFRTASMIHPTYSDEEPISGDDEEKGKAVDVKEDPQFVVAVTRDRQVEKESLSEYVSKKREMFLVQYALGVKRDEMRKLEEIAQAEERKLELAEQYLEEDAAMFDEFLKENDKNSVEAIKIAESETKAKLEKVAEIKKINSQMMSVKSEISKYEDTLKEYQLYKRFLEELTPKEWIQEIYEEKHKLKEAKRRDNTNASTKLKSAVTSVESGKSAGVDAKPSRSRKISRTPGTPSRTGSSIKTRTPAIAETESQVSLSETDESDSDEEPQLYFTDPQQLLDIFSELEENNLSLIQNSQETEEALEEMKQSIKQTISKMEKETSILKEQIDKLNNSINKEEEKAKDLEIKARMFSYGEFKAEDQEKMLQDLNKKVESVYASCIGDNEANISTLQMLTNIENRLEELFEQIEMMAPDRVEAAQKSKDKERRLKLREEKIEQQRIHQEERVKRALERAKAEPKKQTGRKLVPRSEPPTIKKHEDAGADQAQREEEELAYFFTP